jgi:hypothetical protein
MDDDPNPERREEFRREIECHVEPQNRSTLQTDKLAIELGQSGLRTATLLNGGALVAIPAVITLFGIDAKYILCVIFFSREVGSFSVLYFRGSRHFHGYVNGGEPHGSLRPPQLLFFA